MKLLQHSLSGPAITNSVMNVAKQAITEGFQKGKDTVNQDFAQAKTIGEKSDLMFGAVFGTDRSNMHSKRSLISYRSQPVVLGRSVAGVDQE